MRRFKVVIKRTKNKQTNDSATDLRRVCTHGCWQLITHLLPYVQSSVNPFIYSFMSHNFRCTVQSLWRRLHDSCRHCGAPGADIARRDTDWNLMEFAVDGRSVRNKTSLANTRQVRTASMMVWATHGRTWISHACPTVVTAPVIDSLLFCFSSSKQWWATN